MLELGDLGHLPAIRRFPCTSWMRVAGRSSREFALAHFRGRFRLRDGQLLRLRVRLAGAVAGAGGAVWSAALRAVVGFPQ